MKYLFLLTTLILLPTAFLSAQIENYFQLSQKTQNGFFEVVLAVDTGTKTLNAFEVSLSFDPQKLSFSSIAENKDIGVALIEQPKASSEGIIKLYGVVPGGFQNTFDPLLQKYSPTPVVTLFFKPKNPGNTTVSLSDGAVYKHTEQGIRVATKDRDFYFEVNKADSTESSSDVTPPTIQALQVINTNQTKGTTSLFVDTFDTESGISKIEIQQRGEWVLVGNPIAVERKLFKQTILVRVTDGVGNRSLSTAYVPGTSPFIIFLFFVIIIVLSIFIWLRRKYRFFS